MHLEALRIAFLVPELFWFLRATDLQSFEIHGWAFFSHSPDEKRGHVANSRATLDTSAS